MLKINFNHSKLLKPLNVGVLVGSVALLSTISTGALASHSPCVFHGSNSCWDVVTLRGANFSGRRHHDIGFDYIHDKWYVGPRWYGHVWNSSNLDEGTWARCDSNTNQADCASTSFSLGRSKCVSQGFDIGANFTVPGGGLQGLGFSGGYNRSYSTCSTQNQTYSCQGKPGKIVRPVMKVSRRGADISMYQRYEGQRGRWVHWEGFSRSMVWPRYRFVECESRNM